MPIEIPLHRTSRSLTVVLCILLFLITASTVALATGGTMTGSGTEADPYLVADYADLKTVGVTYGLDKIYRLAADIDASTSASENGGNGFTPIGTSSKAFTGAFHGGGHVIRNLTTRPASIYYVGLFASNRGTIDSLGMINVRAQGQISVGGLVGIDSAAIWYCSVTGTVKGYTLVGGLVGSSLAGSAILNSYSTCTVTGSQSMVGGLIGRTNAGTLVRTSYATGPVTGLSDVGGLIGINHGTAANSYATGSAKSAGGSVGGYAGSNGATGVIIQGYSTGEVTGGSQRGGFVGYNDNGGWIGSCFWDSLSSGSAYGVGINMGSADVKGSPTPLMRRVQGFSAWDFDTTWVIRQDSTYPGIFGIDNAPFAFADTITTATRIVSLAQLLLNDRDIESAGLLLRVASVTRGTTDSVSTLTFADTIANRTTSILMYRVAEIQGTDTLWGNMARSIITLDTVVVALPAGREVPASFALGQNFPNPFNPSTTIRYALPQRSAVVLTIFNSLGQQVASPVQGEQEAGYYEITIDATGLASGVYFYRLQARPTEGGQAVEYIAARKLLFLK